MAQLNFNIEENEDTTQGKRDFTPIPKGLYDAMITKSEVRQSMKGGEYLKVEFTLTSEYQGRKIWQNYTLVNENEKAQKIGLGQLSALCKACGKTGIVADSTELHDIEIIIKVDVGEFNGKATNEVKGAQKKDSSKTGFETVGSYNMETKVATFDNKAASANFSDEDIDNLFGE